VTDLQAGSVLHVPRNVVEIATTLRAAGYETWCVGGAVRDAMLGVTSLDWDVATAATPPVVRRLFRRTIPVGIEFGTVGVLDRDGVMHEVTTFRRDVHTDGRHAVVEFGASLDEDLARRDFTMNAIAFDPVAGVVRDPFNGRDDLYRRVVRAVGDPNARMEEDRLRALRAIRFAARFGFAIDDETWQAIVGSAPFMSRLSPERVKQELEKTMDQIAHPSHALAKWKECGAFGTVVPSLENVTEETLYAVDQCPKPGLKARPMRRSLRFAVLFSELTGQDTERALKALRFSNQEISWIGALAGAWHSFGESLTENMLHPDAPSDVALRKLAASVGRLQVGPFLRLAAARWDARRLSAAASVPTSLRVHSVYRRALRIAFTAAISVADLNIDGEDLRRLGLPPGPLFRQLLARLIGDVVEDPSRNERSVLLSRAQQLASESSHAH